MDVIPLLRSAAELCREAVDVETNPHSAEAFNAVISDIEAAIALLEEDRPAIPLGE